MSGLRIEPLIETGGVARIGIEARNTWRRDVRKASVKPAKKFFKTRIFVPRSVARLATKCATAKLHA
ncbi:MAG TPA: hypothetical protein VL282_15720, partial [Tepidisphaeraceae bacterium]|nr:hypothetical protein [Tepidisphaeraceae bacterium]